MDAHQATPGCVDPALPSALLQVLAAQLQDNIGNRLTTALANGLLHRVAAVVAEHAQAEGSSLP